METIPNDKWLIPGYYKEFACKCSSCRNCCCSGWRIGVSMKDYFKLIGMECPDELHRRIETAFTVPEIPTECRYRVISPNWLGVCPVLSEKGLCLIQRDYGENALPDVCRLYPRSLKYVGKLKTACCSNSCEGVIELLTEKEDIPLSFEDCSMLCEDGGNNDADEELFLRCLVIMADDSKDTASRIEATASLLKTKTRFIGITELLSVLSKVSANAPNVLPYVEEIKERYGRDPALFEKDEKALYEKYPKTEKAFSNVLLNHMIYVSFPYTDARIKKERSITGLSMTYELMKVFTACHVALEHDKDKTNEAFADSLAAVFHLTEHTPFYFNAYLTNSEFGMRNSELM